MSFRRTLEKIRKTFIFPKDFSYVKKYFNSCGICARKAPRNAKRQSRSMSDTGNWKICSMLNC